MFPSFPSPGVIKNKIGTVVGVRGGRGGRGGRGRGGPQMGMNGALRVGGQRGRGAMPGPRGGRGGIRGMSFPFALCPSMSTTFPAESPF
jgi:hypothetical protein